MKDNDFNMDNPIEIKDLADTIKNISDSEFDEEVFNIDSFKKSGLTEMIEQILSEQLSETYEPATEEDIFEEIVDNFFILIQELGVDEFNLFQFKSYDYCREIIVDGKEYDLDGEFCHDDLESTEALCAIDCLIADLDNYDEETVIENIEKRINIRNKK